MSTAIASPAAPPSRSSSRGWVALAVAVAAGFLVLGLLGEAFAPGPQGPSGSSYATSPGGVAAWAELLSRAGHPVRQLRQRVASVQLPAASTLVVLGPVSLGGEDVRSLRSFVEDGGRLVIGGGDPGKSIRGLLADLPRWVPAGPDTVHPVASVPEVRGVWSVLSAGEGAFTSGPGVTALGGRGSAALIVRTLGRGKIMMLADPSPLENRLLASADNALLSLNLVGDARSQVAFAESPHGFGAATGLAAIPTRWWLCFGGLCLGAAAWALSRGRRLGPPEAPPQPEAPPRSAYVWAMASLLLRSSDSRSLKELWGRR